MYITHPEAILQARLLGNQEGASSERYVFGTLSAICLFQTPSFLAPALFQLLRYRPLKIGPEGGDTHRRVRMRFGSDWPVCGSNASFINKTLKLVGLFATLQTTSRQAQPAHSPRKSALVNREGDS